jgi:hypothetical protein
MRECIDLGSAPAMEACAQVGSEDYWSLAQRECRAFLLLIRRTCGEEPEGASLRIKENPHDFGTYLSVVCWYESSNQAAVEYAFRCDAQAPQEWDEQALRELVKRERRRT